MEILARNLPTSMTERSVKQFFKPHLERVGVITYHCHKLSGKSFAKITLTDIETGKKFLELHGQNIPGKEGFKSVKVKLFHMRRPVNISQSDHIPDQFLLSSLASEKARKSTAASGSQRKSTQRATQQRAFSLRRISCGQFNYSYDQLQFSPYFQQDRNGRIVFGRRSVVVDLKPLVHQSETTPGHQIEIPYDTVESFTTGTSANPTLTFSLSEAPRLFER